MFDYKIRQMTVAEEHDPACHWRCQFCPSAAIAQQRVEMTANGHPVTFSACEQCAKWFESHGSPSSSPSK